MGTPIVIDRFVGPYKFLSNFSDDPVVYNFFMYQTAEHAFQAAKTVTVNDHNLVANQPSPGQAKKAGRSVPLRSDWEQVKLRIMEDIVRSKFMHSTNLTELLISTGDAGLVEGNHWGDTYWGVCNGAGENHLGRILMKIRKELRGE